MKEPTYLNRLPISPLKLEAAHFSVEFWSSERAALGSDLPVVPSGGTPASQSGGTSAAELGWGRGKLPGARVEVLLY